MKKLMVGVGPLTNTIYAGHVSGNLWCKDKADVTIDALCAVAEHVIRFGEPVVISKEDGTPEYKIIVEKLS